MKLGILACALAAVLGMSGVADACHKGHVSNSNSKGVKGRIASVGKSSFRLAVGASASGKVVTVNFGNGSRITGAPHGVIDSSLVGESASVVGTGEGATINASAIVISAPQHHHAKSAA